MKVQDLPFSSVWVADFEFTPRPGEIPKPVCLVAHELKSGRRVRLFGDDLLTCKRPPYEIDETALFVGYYVSAEFSCHLPLGWGMPARIIDLYTEFFCLTNGRDLLSGDRSLLGALIHFGIPAIEHAEKQRMRELAMRGAPYTDGEVRALLDYCEWDVRKTGQLFEAMLPRIPLPYALVRGRYMPAVASMENTGVPIDVEARERLVLGWDDIKIDLIASVDGAYGVFDAESFRVDRFERYLAANQMAWPRLASQRLDLKQDTFREMSRVYPQLQPLHELRHALSELRVNALEVGADGRNRVLLSPFRASSSRNAPSNTKFIFGPACWLRSLIRPREGFAIAYIDYEQQEFGIAAALSGDPNMMSAYASGDPYLAFGKQAGRIPGHGTKATHGAVRELFKTCCLGVQYGMGDVSLALRLGAPPVVARDLLDLHHRTYPRFWRWSDAAVEHAMLLGHLRTVFGWTVHVGLNPNPRSLRNFPMQANGAEMLRLAACLATERGIGVCAPIHDALLIEAPTSEIEDAVHHTELAMAEASRIILGGFELRTESKIVRHPDRYVDPRGRLMWVKVQELLAKRSR